MTRRQRSHRPRILLIASQSAHAELRDTLVEQGFMVTMTRSLMTGYAQIQRLLTPKQPLRPLLILLDVAGYDPGFPEFPGSVLVAALAGQMRAGTLQTAWVIGISTEQHAERDSEALIAGCQAVLRVPLSAEDLLWLRKLAARSAPIPHHDAPPSEARVIAVLQVVAQRVLDVVEAAQARIWTPEEVALVLRWLTTYPALSGSAREKGRDSESLSGVQQLLRALGGVRSARQRLESIADQWQSRYPLHSEILRRFLEGWERREIVRSFVDRGLYEDSRIYACIKELPRRISEQFTRDQMARQELR